jgi:hypothetical protein
MFAKSKVSQSMVDAVNQVVETAPIKEPTPTGTRVYGGSYGNSAKAKQDQTKSAVDTLKGPKDKEMKEELKGDQHKIDANHNDKIDAQDFKILKGKKKVKEDMDFAKKLLEVAKTSPAKNTDVADKSWLKDAGKKPTVKSDLKNLGRFLTGKKETNEEVEQIEELKKSTLGSYVKKASKDLHNTSFDHGEDEHRQYGDAEDDSEAEANMKKRERDIENRQKGINRAANKLTKEEVMSNAAVTTDTIAGRMPGGKSNSFKSFKMRVKPLDKEGDEDKEVPACDIPEKTSARASIHAEEAELDDMINEVLSKDATAGDWIHDFVHSDNPKFDGKSKAERKKMALGAYYGKQNEESLNEYSMDDVRRDAAEHLKKSMNKQSNDRIQALKKPKSFLQKVGDKQIGMIKGAIKGLRGESAELEEGQMKRLATDKEEDSREGSWRVETPWKKSTVTVTDKSGAQHTPMSRARDLARQAFKKVQDKTKIKAN